MEQNTTPSNSAAPGGSQVPPRNAWMHNKKLIAAVAVAILVILGGVLAVVFLGKDDKKQTNNNTPGQTQNNATAQLDQNDPFVREHLQGCKDRTVAFTQPPVPFAQMSHILPMGMVNDGHVTPTDHVYVAPLNSQAADNTYDVVMPADGTVTYISAMPAQYVGDRNQQVAPEDHRLVIAHNCQYVSIFIHVHQLSEALQNALGGKLEPNTSKQVSIDLKADDKLGRIGGNPVDWSLMDAKQTLKGFITPDLYKRESWKIHVIDPISMYTGETKQQMIAKSLRNVEPYGGKIDYDKPGALVGNWFRQGTNGYEGADMSRYWDGHLSIAPNYIDTTATTVSIGNWEGKAAQFTAKAGTPDPAGVTKDSGAVKYELVAYSATANGQPWSGNSLSKDVKLMQTGTVKGTILVQVMDGEKLKFETFPGKTAAQVSGFTNAAQMYER